MKKELKESEEHGETMLQYGVCMQMIHCEMIMVAMRDEAIVEYAVKKESRYQTKVVC